ncbi:MAG: hypothetical protein KDF62_08055 [Nitrosomonas sp.]|nr:hypothetical protein [Nitrosomonas sp.]
MGSFFQNIIQDSRRGISSIEQTPESDAQPITEVGAMAARQTAPPLLAAEYDTVSKTARPNTDVNFSAKTDDAYASNHRDEKVNMHPFADRSKVHGLSDELSMVAYRTQDNSMAEPLTQTGGFTESQSVNIQSAVGESVQQTETPAKNYIGDGIVRKWENGIQSDPPSFLPKTRANDFSGLEPHGLRKTRHDRVKKSGTVQLNPSIQGGPDDLEAAANKNDDVTGVRPPAIPVSDDDAQTAQSEHVQTDLDTALPQQKDIVQQTFAVKQAMRGEKNEPRSAMGSYAVQYPQVKIGVVNVIVEGPKQTKAKPSGARPDDQSSRRYLRSL